VRRRVRFRDPKERGTGRRKNFGSGWTDGQAYYLLIAFTLASTVLWGRLYCGRICAFGALTQLMDRVAPARLRVEPDFTKAPVRQIHVVRWPDGRELWAPDGGYRGDFTAGKITGFSPGMALQIRIDDSSEEFDREYRERFPERARRH